MGCFGLCAMGGTVDPVVASCGFAVSSLGVPGNPNPVAPPSVLEATQLYRALAWALVVPAKC